MPVVFAIQNSRYAAALDLSFHYEIYKGSGLEDLIDYRVMILKYADFSSSDPYYALDSVPYMNSTEGNWSIWWKLYASNCSYAPPAEGQGSIGATVHALQCTPCTTPLVSACQILETPLERLGKNFKKLENRR
jgi:hypothetical protein